MTDEFLWGSQRVCSASINLAHSVYTVHIKLKRNRYHSSCMILSTRQKTRVNKTRCESKYITAKTFSNPHDFHSTRVHIFLFSRLLLLLLLLRSAFSYDLSVDVYIEREIIYGRTRFCFRRKGGGCAVRYTNMTGLAKFGASSCVYCRDGREAH